MPTLLEETLQGMLERPEMYAVSVSTHQASFRILLAWYLASRFGVSPEESFDVAGSVWGTILKAEGHRGPLELIHKRGWGDLVQMPKEYLTLCRRHLELSCEQLGGSADFLNPDATSPLQ